VFPNLINTLTYKINKISIITIIKISDNDRHQLTDTTNPLNLLSNHSSRNIPSSCPHIHFHKSQSERTNSNFFFISNVATRLTMVLNSFEEHHPWHKIIISLVPEPCNIPLFFFHLACWVL